MEILRKQAIPFGKFEKKLCFFVESDWGVSWVQRSQNQNCWEGEIRTLCFLSTTACFALHSKSWLLLTISLLSPWYKNSRISNSEKARSKWGCEFFHPFSLLSRGRWTISNLLYPVKIEAVRRGSAGDRQEGGEGVELKTWEVQRSVKTDLVLSGKVQLQRRMNRRGETGFEKCSVAIRCGKLD